MAAELLFTVDARADIDEAYAWYERRRPGLGQEFLAGVGDCLQRILGNPELYPMIDTPYRRVMLHRFPYVVIYEFDGGNVTVYAVYHTKRSQGDIRRRLP